MIDEIVQIPEAARRCYDAGQGVRLPLRVPYLGMGSSYFAALALKHQGVDIRAELASEYFYSIAAKSKKPLGVLISQSGASSEVLWCRDLFERYIAVVNDEISPLARDTAPQDRLFLKAGKEQFTSSKTYINTLVALYSGLGINPKGAIDSLASSMSSFRDWGEHTAEIIFDRIFHKRLNGIALLGSGPNVATARMGALGLQESAKLAAMGLSTAEYDHGPKEAAQDSVVISVEAPGPAFERSRQVLQTAKRAGATTLEIPRTDLSAHLTPITHIVPLFFLMYFLAEKLGIQTTFSVGAKITEAKI